MNTNKEFSRQRVLQWTLIAAVTLCLLTAVTTIGLLWWMRNRPSTEATTSIAPRPSSAANWSPVTFSSQAPNGVRQTSEKSWSVKGGRAFMNVRSKDDESIELRFAYPFDFLPRETVMLVQTRWDLREVEKQADALNITPDQIAALKTLSPATDMPVSAPDKEQLRALFDEYLSAKDSAAEKALVEAVVELDAKYYDRTVERIEGLAEKVKNIFNQDQLTALFERYQNRNARDSAKTATRTP